MKILIVQTAFLGDVILSVPVITGLRKLYPEAEIYFLTTKLAAPIVESFTEVKQIILQDKSKEHAGVTGIFKLADQLKAFDFDLCINLHKSYRTAIVLRLAKIKKTIAFKHAKFSFLYDQQVQQIGQHAVERFFSILNYQQQKLKPELTLPIVVDSVSLLDKFKIPKKFIAIAPGSVWLTKRWSARHYQSLVKELVAEGWQIVAFGSADEQELVDYVIGSSGISLAGKTDLQETFSILSCASALVCNDSMILHAASALKVPTVAVFCATSPEFGFGPYQERATVVENQKLTCKPCSRHGQMACPLYTNSCMEDVAPEEVLIKLKELTSKEVL